MPATLASPRSPWHNYGSKYIKTGASRGTTTGSGVFSFDTGFPRAVEFAIAYDYATNTRNYQPTAGGPQATTSTFFMFQPLVPSGTSARFRVIRFKATSDMNGSFTLGSALTAVSCRWFAVGF